MPPTGSLRAPFFIAAKILVVPPPRCSPHALKTYIHELASGKDKGKRKKQFERNERILIWRDSGRIKSTTTIVEAMLSNLLCHL